MTKDIKSFYKKREKIKSECYLILLCIVIGFSLGVTVSCAVFAAKHKKNPEKIEKIYHQIKEKLQRRSSVFSTNAR